MDSTLRWLYKVSGKCKGYIVALTLSQGASGCVGVLYALLMRDIVDSAVAKNADAFRHYVTLIICLVIAQIALGAVISWLSELSRSDMENILKRRVVDAVLRKDYASVSAIHSAEWLNRITGDTSTVANGVISMIPNLVGTIVRFTSALVMIISLDPVFAAILVPGGILMGILAFLLRRVLKRLHKNIQETDGALRIYLQERISSLMVIKAFTAEAQTGEGAAERMTAHKAARLRRNRFSNTANIGFGAAMQGMYLIGVVYCAHGIMTGRVSYGTLTAVMQLIGQVQGPFANISGYLPRWYAMTASAERLMEAERFADDVTPMAKEEAGRIYERMTALGFRDVSFRYPAEDSPVVLDRLNLEIHRGETVAFTGHSGCGKSTVLKLLMCMYPPDSGERYLSTSQGTEALTAAYRRLFAYVPQGNALMNGTIREAVCFAEEADDERLKYALTVACADEFVDDTEAELGERGSGLSEGQMQRLAVARAIYADAPVLLLDESTSALDEGTEKRLLENLRNMTDKTVVIVTHRKAALSICDRVLAFTKNGIREVSQHRSASINSPE